MNEFFSKLFDKIFSIKGGAIFALSFVLGTIGVAVFPDVFEELYKSLPFENNSNVTVGFTAIVCSVYLLLFFAFDKLPKLINKFQYAFESYIQRRREYEDEIDSLRCLFDGVSDSEYAIVFSLLNSRNKEPYIANCSYLRFDERSLFSFSCGIKLFNVHRVNTSNGNYTSQYAYILKPDIYLKLSRIYKKYKRLSYIERKVDMSDTETHKEE